MPAADVELAKYLDTQAPDSDSYYSISRLAEVMMARGVLEADLSAELVKWAARGQIRTSIFSEFEVTERGNETIRQLLGASSVDAKRD